MRRVLTLIAGLSLLTGACADGSGAPLEDADVPTVESLSDADGEASAPADLPEEEPGDASLAGTEEPIVVDLEDASEPEEEEKLREENPKPEPVAPSLPPPPTESSLPVVTGEVPGDLLEAIMADAESKMSTEGSLTIIRAQAVTWPDGSLGCPEPGMMYTQALVDGYWVVLDAAGQTMDYRAGSGGGFKYCPFGGTPPTEPADR